MKFLLEFVSCCGSCKSNIFGEKKSNNGADGGSGSRWSEETRALMLRTIVSRRGCNRRKKRGRVGTSMSPTSSGSLADNWKPTLSSISEDNVAGAAVGVDPKAQRRTGTGGRPGGGSRNIATLAATYNDDRRNHFTVIPTFSATPFMI